MTYIDRAPETEAHKEEESGRRTFLTKLIALGGLAWAAAAAYPVLSFLNAPKIKEEVVTEIELDEADKYKPGSVTKFGFGNTPAFLILDDDGSFSAISAICTHLGCVISPKGAGFSCPCHGGKYDITGKNIAGPPPKPLEKFRAEIKDGKVWVFRS